MPPERTLCRMVTNVPKCGEEEALSLCIYVCYSANFNGAVVVRLFLTL